MRFDPQSNYVPTDIELPGGTAPGGAGGLIRGLLVLTLLGAVGAGVTFGVRAWNAGELTMPELPDLPDLPDLAALTSRGHTAPVTEDDGDRRLARALDQLATGSSRTDHRTVAVPRPGSPAVATTGDRSAATRDQSASRLITRHQARRALAEGRDHLNAGRSADAVRALRRAVELEPGNADAHYKLGLALIRIGEVESAQHEQSVLRELDPNLANLLGNLVRHPRSRTIRTAAGGEVTAAWHSSSAN